MIACESIRRRNVRPHISCTRRNAHVLRALRGKVNALRSVCDSERWGGALKPPPENYPPRGLKPLSIDTGPPVGGPLGATTPRGAGGFVHGLTPDGPRRWEPGVWPVVLDDASITLEYRVTALPMKYLLDSTGKIVWTYRGWVTGADYAALEAQIVSLVG